MALSILDGNQSATTLSTILSSGQHITAHTVISLGTQAITDIVNATSAGLTNTQLRASAVTVGGTVTVGNSVTISSLPSISGTVTANVFGKDSNQIAQPIRTALIGSEDLVGGYRLAVGLANSIGYEFGTAYSNPFLVGGYSIENDATKTLGVTTAGDVRAVLTSALPAGTNRIGVVTIGAGTVTIGAGTAQIGSVTASISNFPATQAVSLTTLPALVAGTAQIGSVTASISGTVPVSGTFFQATQPASLASLPALAAGTNQIGSVTASISGTVPISISSVTVGNSVTIGSLPALTAGTAQIGSVTASISANPSGALTTRFGSVTTANTAQITTAVTNTSRKYLFAQNISIGSVTMGIGFSPTTTQGIQLSAGSGIVFDSFCPTGAVYWLGATTGAAWSILEG